MKRVRAIRGTVLLLDDQPETVQGGVVVRIGSASWRRNLDYLVASAGSDAKGFGAGDRVLLRDASAGKSLFLDGVAYRLVKTSDVVGRADP